MTVPIIVIVPGACQPPPLYVPFAKALETRSLPSSIIPTPSCGASPGLKDFSADVTLIRDTVSKHLDAGKDVVVLMHSYGGIPGSAALKGLGKSERNKHGQGRGVLRLIYVCSFALREGETMPDAGNIELLRKYASEGLNEEAGTLAVTHAGAALTLFDELPATESQHWASLMQPHSLGALWSTQTYAAWQDIPSTYVISNLDRIISAKKQEEMIKSAQEVQPKAFDVVERLDTGHEPILTKIDEMVHIVERATRDNCSW